MRMSRFEFGLVIVMAIFVGVVATHLVSSRRTASQPTVTAPVPIPVMVIQPTLSPEQVKAQETQRELKRIQDNLDHAMRQAEIERLRREAEASRAARQRICAQVPSACP